MPKVQIGVRARLFLMGQLSQVGGELDDPARLAAAELFRLVAVPVDELPLYETTIPGLGVHLNLANIRNAEPLAVELSPSQIGLALSTAKKFGKYSIHDDEWARPLVADLEAALARPSVVPSKPLRKSA